MFETLYNFFMSLRYFTRRFGSPLNWDTATYETYHKVAVGQPFKRDNHHEGMTQRLPQYAMMWATVMTVLEESRPDPNVRNKNIYPKKPFYGGRSYRYRHIATQKSNLKAFIAKYSSSKRVQKALATAVTNSPVFKAHKLKNKKVQSRCVHSITRMLAYELYMLRYLRTGALVRTYTGYVLAN